MSDPAAIEARLHRVEVGMQAIQTTLERLSHIAERFEELYAKHLRAEGAAEERRAHQERLDALPDEVSDVRRRLEVVERQQAAAERPVMVHDEPRPRIWESPEGQRVLWWGFGAAVLCSLAVGGGLTFEALMHWLPGGATPP